MNRYLVLIVVGALLFLPFLGGVHLFDWDEINFAECAREMIVSGDYLRPQIDFMPFWEKPPFFIWLQVIAMKLFGVGEYAARFPNAVIGIVTLCAVYYAGRRSVSDRVGMLWAGLFAASWLPHLYFKSGIIDPTFNLFIFLAFFQVYLAGQGSRPWLHAILAGLMLGMAVITKGPVAILVALLSLSVYVVLSKGFGSYKVKHLLAVVLFAAVPFAIWMAAAALINGAAYGRWYLNEFFQYQVRLFSTEDSDHGGPFIYHFVVLLAGCFPASIFLFQYIGKRTAREVQGREMQKWMWIMFWVVLILFSIVKTKIVHYSSLCYFPLTFLAAAKLAEIVEGKAPLKAGVRYGLLFMGAVWAVLLIALPLVGLHKQQLVPIIADKFVVANLRATVAWSYAECLWGLGYLVALSVSVRMLRTSAARGSIALLATQVVAIQVAILHFTPKVEAYSQRAAIGFFAQFAGRDVYVQPLGYKSYANLFYTRKGPYTAKEYVWTRTDDKGRQTPEANSHWLIYGNTDKPAYFICKINDSAEYAAKPQLRLIGSRNGFVFFQKVLAPGLQ